MNYRKQLLFACIVVLTCVVCLCIPFSFAHADMTTTGQDMGIFLVDSDAIHLLTPNGCFRFTEDHQFVPCDKNCMNGAFFEEETTFDEVIAEQGRLKFAQDSFHSLDGKAFVANEFERNEIYYWDVDATMPWVHFATLDREIFDQYPSNQYISEYAVSGNTVYVLFVHMNGGNCELYAFDNATGQGKRIYADQRIDRLFTLPDENKVAVSQWNSTNDTNILSIDKNSLEVEKMIPNDAGEHWTRFFINEDGTGYATDYHRLYQIKNGKATELQKITEDLGGYGCLRLCPYHKDEVLYSAYLNGEKLIFTVPRKGSDELHPLTIVGKTNELHQSLPTTPSLTKFILQHGNLAIEYADYPSTFDEIAQAMMAKNDKFDIILLSFTNGDLKKLYQRGYACNLSDIPALNDYFASLYPVWRDACSVDGHMFAMPLSTNGSQQLMRNTALWNELALGDVPTTYDQLFDCIQRWDEQGALEEAPLFGAGINSHETLFWKLMFDYIAASDRQGSGLSFQDETFQHLMKRLEDLRPTLDAHDARSLSGDMMIYTDGRITSIKFDQFDPAYPVETLEPMPLALSDSLGCAERVYLYALMVNPYSAQRKLAEKFLVYLSQNITITSQCLFMDNGIEGYEREEYQEELAKLDKDKEFYQNELEKARQAENTDLIEFWQNSIENTEGAKKTLPRWNISPEEVAKYQTALPHLAILQRTNFQLLYENGLSTMQQYLDGRMTLDQMCRRLDEIVRMNAMED